MLNARTLFSFTYELEKIALGMNTFQSYLGQRAAQGVGGAAALKGSLAGAAATTTREAVQGMSGLQKHRLGGVMEGGQAIRKMEQLPNKVGLGPTAANTRQRVGDAIKEEGTLNNSRKGGNTLSAGYEGYMTNSRRSYNPEHVGKVMGITPEEAKVVSKGPTHLMKGGLNNERSSAVRVSVPPTNMAEVTQPTVPSSVPPAMPSAPMGATVPPPGRRRRG